MNKVETMVHQVNHTEENASVDGECSSYAAFFENVLIEDIPTESIKNGSHEHARKYIE